LDLLKKLDKDNVRLDRALDKINTEEKANRIFNHHLQTPIYSHIGYINSNSAYPQPVHITHVNNKYIIVNGCFVIRQNEF
jgi:hypothetical protein